MVAIKNIFVDDAERMGKRVATTTNKPVIAIDADVNAAMDLFCGLRRIKRGTISDILRWFLSQAPSFQRAVLGEPDTAGMEKEYAAVLRRMADKLDPRPPSNTSPDEVLHARTTPAHPPTPPAVSSKGKSLQSQK